MLLSKCASQCAVKTLFMQVRFTLCGKETLQKSSGIFWSFFVVKREKYD